MDVDVADAEVEAGFQVAAAPGVVEFVAAGLVAPFRGVELDAFEAEAFGVAAELVEARLFEAWVEAVVVGEFVGVFLGEGEGFFGLAEAVVVEGAEVGGLEDGVVDVAVLEEVLHQSLAAVVEVLLVGPQLGFGAEVAVVVVEAVDELLAVDVGLVLRPGVPERDVRVHDEVAFAVLGVHGFPPRS